MGIFQFFLKMVFLGDVGRVGDKRRICTPTGGAIRGLLFLGKGGGEGEREREEREIDAARSCESDEQK